MKTAKKSLQTQRTSPGLETETRTEPRAYGLGYVPAPLRGGRDAFHTRSESERVRIAGALLHRSNSRQ